MNKWKLSLFLLVLSLWACDSTTLNLKEDTSSEVLSTEHKSDADHLGEPTGFHLNWGKQKIVLYKYPNSVFKGGGEMVELNDFLGTIQEPINLVKKGKQVPFEVVNIHRTSFEAGLPRFWQPRPKLINQRFGPELVREIREKVEIGNGVQMHLFSPSDSTDFYVSLYVNDPFADYKPMMKVRSNYFSQVFGFQLIQKEDRPAILRLDTTQISTKRVLNLFSESPSYKILHIPNFETRRRIWRVDLFTNKDISKTLFLENKYDLLTLPEYIDYSPRKIVLQWGKMESRLNSENYTNSFFRKNLQQPYTLYANDKPLSIKSGRVIIANEAMKPECIITADFNHPEVIKRLFRLGGGFSVYLDQLVVENERGKIYHFPEGFAFHIEKSKEFELELSETQFEKTQANSAIAVEGSGVKINLRSIALEDLMSYLLKMNKQEIMWNGFKEPLYFDVAFSSNTIGEEEARNLILTKLQHHLKFSLLELGEDPLLTLLVQDSSLLKPNTEGEVEFSYKLSEDQGLKKIEVVKTSLSELASLIAYDMNIPVVNLTDLQGQFDFNLTYEDKTDLTRQLQTYGLTLDWYNEEVKVMISKF